MLYLVRVHIDQHALGTAERRAEIADAEARRAREVQAAGQLLGLWRRADATGAVFVVDVASSESLNVLIQNLPLFPYLRDVDVVPLVAHPAFPEFSRAPGP